MKASDFVKWDLHHHIVPDFYVEELQRLGLTNLSGIAYPKWKPAASLKAMKSLNIARAFLSLSGPGVYFRDASFSRTLARRCNDYLAGVVRENPDKFGGFASVPLPDVEGALTELSYSLDTLKLDGIVLMSSVNDVYLGHQPYRPFFTELDKRGATVFIHPNMAMNREDHQLLNPLHWWQFDTTRTLIDYIRSGYHREFPHIKFILSHGGGVLTPLYHLLIQKLKPEIPAIESELEVWKPQLFLDTASKGYDEQLALIVGFSGSNHVVYGSDFPWASSIAGRMIANRISDQDVQQGLTQTQIQGIFMGNAQQSLTSTRAVPTDILAKLINVQAKSASNSLKYHYHCLPESVIKQLQELGINDLGNRTVWDAQQSLTWINDNGYGKLMLSLDIPAVWKLNSYERASVLRTYNTNVMSIREENPAAFGAFGAIDCEHLTYGISEIDYCLNDLKLDGICLYTNIAKTSVDEFIHPRILEKLATLRVPILIHPQNTDGIPLADENYLDAVYFMAKAFFLGLYEQYFQQSQLILTHTAGLIPYVAQPYNILGYMQLHKKKIPSFVFDNFIRKQPKGYNILMNMLVD